MSDRLNRYTCQKCAGSIITKDIDEGVTPFSLGCRAKAGCGGMMFSSLYRNVAGQPDYVWRKPTPAEYAKAHPAMKHHFDMGGLDIYQLTQPESPEVR